MKRFKKFLAYFVCAILVCLPLASCSKPNDASDITDVALAESQQVAQDKIVCSVDTPLLDKENGRVNNIKKAADEINQVTLKSGDVFSFNDVVGERTSAKGYQEAVALSGKKKVRQVGGGVCQLSSTIFQAAKGANLEIVERHPHQKKVPYAKKNTDAAIAYNTFDLKFKNNGEKTLKIYATVTNDKVCVTIYSV